MEQPQEYDQPSSERLASMPSAVLAELIAAYDLYAREFNVAALRVVDAHTDELDALADENDAVYALRDLMAQAIIRITGLRHTVRRLVGIPYSVKALEAAEELLDIIDGEDD